MGESDTDKLKSQRKKTLKKNEVVNQSIMRYNQLFASQITITIPG